MDHEKGINTYFAAANGYCGFRSYFNNVFSPCDYTRLYILKGGPGTGKSSLMKKIRNHFEKQGVITESVLCSSDPSSLDGIIIEAQKKKFAIIDGTAPHETDAKIPGAVDEIINLGRAWDRDTLSRQREKILKINNFKKSHYKNAYGYLRLAGNFSIKLKDIENYDISKKLNELAMTILSNLSYKKQGSIAKSKLISSFGKTGYATLDAKNFLVKEQFFVAGDKLSSALFIRELEKIVKSRNVDYVRIPSPLSDDILEGLYFTDTDTLVSSRICSENKIDTSPLLSNVYNEEESTISKSYYEFHEELLSCAKEEFQKASEAHFELEDIYTPAMDFEKLNKITDSLIKDIEQQI